MGWDSLETWKDMYMYYTMVEHREEQIGLIFRNCIPVDWFKKSATSTLYLAGKSFEHGCVLVYCDCVCVSLGALFVLFFPWKIIDNQ